jgi:hypothetical protein
LLRSAARSVVRSADYSAGRSSIVSDWSTEFDARSSCPAAARCVLLDAGKYIIGLPKKVHTAAQGQAAIEALILVADRGGPTMFARIGVIKALNSHVERSLIHRDGTPQARNYESKQVWRDVSRYAASLPAALPAAHSHEPRPSALVADKPCHPRQAVPSLAQASSDIPGIHRRASRHHQYV